MTFALPGVEEREPDSDGVCEQLSHLLQTTGYVAGLSKLTLCNALPPSLPPSFSFATLPPSPFLPRPLSLYFFPDPLTVSSTSSLTLSASCYLSQPACLNHLLPSAPASFFFLVWKSLRGAGRAYRLQWISVVLVKVSSCTV